MRFKNGMMIHAAICSMSDPAPPAAAAESIGQEIETGIKTFISNAETDLAADMEDAYTWLKGELAALEPTVLADLKVAVVTAGTNLLAGGTVGATTADVLTQLAADGSAVLASVKSSVVEAVVGLAQPKPATPAV
jgi:hypothetical protein